ncbi:Mitochondrial translation initiation factor IF-2 [Lachnellula arida]|uniref:Translation initiation factor IF-2, mitochondrial n=1 Tax=Lachnellula arida TaxID=1316785 RepID=A0A8T9BDA5_9HELO|nr:Mitochondrial translation initiation factor IF-2 [Lachnellula arida]
MRGRSLLKESTNPSVCAFCAHRLGQARRPSHVQRRFLQSSRPVSKPPAEASALREEHNDGDSRPAAATWGRPNAGNGNLGPTATWGRPGVGQGGIPPAGPAGSWGRPNSIGNGIPAGKIQPGRSNETPGANGLLPHEQRARDLMKEQAAQAQRERELLEERRIKSQQRPITIPTGPGPHTTRAGRPYPYQRTQQELIEEGRRVRAMERERTRERQSEIAAGAPPTSRRIGHVMGDPPSISRSNQQSEESLGWAQLKRQSKVVARDEAKAPEAAKPFDRFVEGRAQREEQAKWGRYTPLGSRSIMPPRDSTFSRTRYQQEDQSRWEASRGAQVSPEQAAEKSLLQSESRSRNSELNGGPEPTVSWSPISKMADVDQAPKVEEREKAEQASKGAESKMAEPEDDNFERSAREGRGKKISSRFASDVQPSYSKLPKGKERDKAKRRERFVNEDEVEDAEQQEAQKRAELKKQRKREKAARKPVPIMLPEFISVSNLAIALHVRLEDFVWKMQELGFEETNHDFILNSENAGLIAIEYNFDPIIDHGDSEDLKAREPAEDPSILPPRPPIVTIMGHVDHGKTTILDYLRKSSVAATEHGGITQHIGAFSVPMPSGKTITFLDTPGHAAFLNMRQRGAVVTDIVILVVAADDSVKPQTIEAIKHAKAANVPIMVAINKIDKEEANIDRVKQDLARHGVDVEDFGGDTQVVCVSGKTGQGMDELEEAAVALSDVLDMRAETDGQAEGWVLEASIKSMGKVATVLVRRGTMRLGDFIVAGKTWARIRCLRNEAGVEIEEAGPGTPVEVDGWREQPLAGDEVLQAGDEQKAKSVIDYRLEREERDKLAEDMDAINENRKVEQEKRDREKAETEAQLDGHNLDIPEQKAGGPKQVYFLVKGDVSGSVEAVIDSIAALGTKEVHPHILRSGVGQLSEFDVEHAAAAKGQLINFNTEVEPHISRAAEQAKVNIINENIIYRLVEHVKAELSKHLPPLITQRVLGEAEISQVFSITVKGRQQKSVAGCKVRNGVIGKNAKVRVMRQGEKVYDGSLGSLKNVKKDVMEMKNGSECGLSFTDWFDFQVGDKIQSYDQKEEKRYL